MRNSEKKPYICYPTNLSVSQFMKNEVFISYSHFDVEIADSIAEELKRRGISCFIDHAKIDLGRDYAGVIARSIRDCEILLFVWSPNSNQSEDAINEIALAVEYQKVIIPFKIGRFEPDFNLNYRLVRYNRMDVVEFNRSEIVELADRIACQLGRTPSEEAACRSEAVEWCQRGDEASRNDEPEEALRCYLRAAEGGNAEAMFRLGGVYDFGMGVPPERSRAVEWWRRAADKGHAAAMNCLGCACSEGDGVPQDAARAAEWWRKAAEMGDATAMLNFAVACEKGRGVTQDRRLAEYWRKRAGEQ